MNRRNFTQSILGISIASALVSFPGCSCSPTPEEVQKGQEECEHEWEEAPSGATWCKKCGKYK